MRLLKTRCGVRLSLFSVITALHLPAQQSPVAFVDVTVVPMDSERLLQHQTVITQSGRIAAVGAVRTTRLPKGAFKIDGQGRFLMPGLADMHVHLNVQGPRGLMQNADYATLFIANGVTTVRNMWGNPDVLAFRRSVESGELLGPQIYTTGALTDGNPPVRPTSRVVDTVSEAVEAVKADRREGYDAVKVYSKLSPEVYSAIVSTARQIGLPVYGHVPENVGVERVLELHQDSIEHVDGYLEALNHDNTASKISELVSKTKMVGTWNCVTLVLFQGLVTTDESTALLAKPSMRFVPPKGLSFWKANVNSNLNSPGQIRYVQNLIQRKNSFVRALHEGGAKI